MPIINETTMTVYEVNGELLDLNGIRDYADKSCWAVADILLRELNIVNIPELKTLSPEHEDALRMMIDKAIKQNARVILGHTQNLVDFMDVIDKATEESGN
jgi:hypothetical protein